MSGIRQVEIEHLIEQLLHIEAIEDEILCELLDFPEAIVGLGGQNFVYTLDNVVWDHSRNTLDVLR